METHLITASFAFVSGALWVDWFHDTPARSMLSSLTYNPPKIVAEIQYKHAWAYYLQAWDTNSVFGAENKANWNVINVVLGVSVISSVIALNQARKTKSFARIAIQSAILGLLMVTLAILVRYVVGANRFLEGSPTEEKMIQLAYSKMYGHWWATISFGTLLLLHAMSQFQSSSSNEKASKRN